MMGGGGDVIIIEIGDLGGLAPEPDVMQPGGGLKGLEGLIPIEDENEFVEVDGLDLMPFAEEEMLEVDGLDLLGPIDEAILDGGGDEDDLNLEADDEPEVSSTDPFEVGIEAPSKAEGRGEMTETESATQDDTSAPEADEDGPEEPEEDDEDDEDTEPGRPPIEEPEDKEARRQFHAALDRWAATGFDPLFIDKDAQAKKWLAPALVGLGMGTAPLSMSYMNQDDPSAAPPPAPPAQQQVVEEAPAPPAMPQVQTPKKKAPQRSTERATSFETFMQGGNAESLEQAASGLGGGYKRHTQLMEENPDKALDIAQAWNAGLMGQQPTDAANSDIASAFSYKLGLETAKAFKPEGSKKQAFGQRERDLVRHYVHKATGEAPLAIPVRDVVGYTCPHCKVSIHEKFGSNWDREEDAHVCNKCGGKFHYKTKDEREADRAAVDAFFNRGASKQTDDSRRLFKLMMRRDPDRTSSIQMDLDNWAYLDRTAQSVPERPYEGDEFDVTAEFDEEGEPGDIIEFLGIDSEGDYVYTIAAKEYEGFVGKSHWDSAIENGVLVPHEEDTTTNAPTEEPCPACGRNKTIGEDCWWCGKQARTADADSGLERQEMLAPQHEREDLGGIEDPVEQPEAVIETPTQQAIEHRTEASVLFDRKHADVSWHLDPHEDVVIGWEELMPERALKNHGPGRKAGERKRAALAGFKRFASIMEKLGINVDEAMLPHIRIEAPNVPGVDPEESYEVIHHNFRTNEITLKPTGEGENIVLPEQVIEDQFNAASGVAPGAESGIPYEFLPPHKEQPVQRTDEEWEDIRQKYRDLYSDSPEGTGLMEMTEDDVEPAPTVNERSMPIDQFDPGSIPGKRVLTPPGVDPEHGFISGPEGGTWPLEEGELQQLMDTPSTEHRQPSIGPEPGLTGHEQTVPSVPRAEPYKQPPQPGATQEVPAERWTQDYP
jgi:hypothetical protein